MKRRKHRLYIDVTYSTLVEYREAAKGLQLTLDSRLDLQKKPVWAHHNSPYIDKVTVTEIRNVWKYS